MRHYRIHTFLSEAVKGIYRNSLSSIVSIISLVLALTVMGSFWMLKVNIDENLATLGDFHKIVVYLELDATAQDAEDIRGRIKEIMKVSDDAVLFTSKEEALEMEKEKYGEEYAYIFDSYKNDANPLPDSYTVSYAEDVKDIDYMISLIGGLDKVESVKNRKDIADKITNLKGVISRVSSALMVMLFIVSIFVIGTTVKLTHEARREEIKIMRYIGATNFFISCPFVLEGIFLGILSALIAYGVVWYAYSFFVANIVANYGNIIRLVSLSDAALPAYSTMSHRVFLLLGFLLVGLLTGVLGTLTTRKHLKA